MSSSASVIQPKARPHLSRLFPTFARMLGNLGWPILLRQLRADFRKNRFFLSQFLCLCVLGVTLIVLISNAAAEQTRTATQIGQGLFKSFFIIQYLIILVVFPAFSSTAFSEERAGLTMDMLLVSSLRPAEIVWGKFLASTVYCLVYVVASIPLLSISFLFGGVELTEVLIAYAILIGMTLFVSMLGVCISSCYASSIRSTITTYVVIFGLLAGSWYVYRQLGLGDEKGAQRTMIGALLRWGGPGFSLNPLHLAVLPGVGFAYLFLVTSNRVRPSSDDRSSPLKVLTFLTVLGFLAAGLWKRVVWAGGRLVPATGSSEWFKDVIVQGALLLLAAALVFPTEEANVSRRNRVRFGKWTGLKYPSRLFAPGAFWGFVYAAVLATAASGGLLLAWKLCFAERSAASLDDLVTQSLVTLPLYVGALSALGFLLAACDFTPVYSRLTVAFILVISLLLPVICMLSKDRETVWTGWDVLWRGYYLSPITLWASLDPTNDDRSQFVLFGAPVIEVARWVFGACTAACLAAGVYLSRRAGYPVLRMHSPRSPLTPPRARRAHRLR